MTEEVVIVTGSGGESDTEAASNAVQAAAEAVEEAAHAIAHEEHAEDASHHCDESCPCRAGQAEHAQQMADMTIALAEVTRLATEAHANSLAAIAFAVEEDEPEPLMDDVTEVAPVPGTEDEEEQIGRKHNLLF